MNSGLIYVHHCAQPTKQIDGDKRWDFGARSVADERPRHQPSTSSNASWGHEDRGDPCAASDATAHVRMKAFDANWLHTQLAKGLNVELPVRLAHHAVLGPWVDNATSSRKAQADEDTSDVVIGRADRPSAP